MRVVVVNSQTPFASGRAEWLAGRLCAELREHGHSTELVRIPFCATPPEVVVDHMLAVRLLRLKNVDRAIALRFPAYFLPFDDKVVWLLGEFGQTYDVRGTRRPEDKAPGREVRSAVRAADRAYLAEARRIHAGSALASRRLSRDLGLASDVLYPPLRDADLYHCDEYGDYLLVLGEICADTPQRLAIEALALARSAIRLVVAGPPRSLADLSALREFAHTVGVESRMEFIPGWISDAERVRLLAGCRALLCLPGYGDSCEQVALEAFHSHKPVVVLADADGFVEPVRDGVSGRAAASVAGLSAAIGELADDAALAERYGHAGFCQVRDCEISWETVVRELMR